MDRMYKSAYMQRGRQTAAAEPDRSFSTAKAGIARVGEFMLTKCDLCPSYFISAADLWRHVRAKHMDNNDDGGDEEGRLVCHRAGCDRKFDSLSALSVHYMLHLGTSDASGCAAKRSLEDRCELCGRTVGDQAALFRHMDTRHPEWRKDGVCNVCGRHVGVNVNAVLEHAMRVHCTVGLSAVHHRPAPQSVGPIRSRVQRRHVHRSGNQLPY